MTTEVHRGDWLTLPSDTAAYGIHAGQTVLVVDKSLTGHHVTVECEDEHTFVVDLDKIDQPSPEEVVYVITVADVEAQVERKISRDEFYKVKDALGNSTIGEAFSDVCFAALGTDHLG